MVAPMRNLDPWDVQDPATTLDAILSHRRPADGDVFVALLRRTDSADQSVADVSRVHHGDLPDRPGASDLLCDEASRLVGPRLRAGDLWAPPKHVLVTVVCRTGRVVPGRIELFWLAAWRYSNMTAMPSTATCTSSPSTAGLAASTSAPDSPRRSARGHATWPWSTEPNASLQVQDGLRIGGRPPGADAGSARSAPDAGVRSACPKSSPLDRQRFARLPAEGVGKQSPAAWAPGARDRLRRRVRARHPRWSRRQEPVSPGSGGNAQSRRRRTLSRRRPTLRRRRPTLSRRRRAR